MPVLTSGLPTKAGSRPNTRAQASRSMPSRCGTTLAARMPSTRASPIRPVSLSASSSAVARASLDSRQQPASRAPS